MTSIGITERGDAAIDMDWMKWVRKGNPAILVTKNPLKLCNILKVSFMEIPNIIVHCTITGWGGTIYEPNVPPAEESLKGYNKMIELLGAERVVLRVDPVIPTDEGIKRAQKVIAHAKTRVRISFLDIYPHVKERFVKEGIHLWNEFHAPFELRYKVWKLLGEPEVCGEPGFKCTGCVSETDCKILGVIPSTLYKNQRPECKCLFNKVEILSGTGRCPHKCLYCYWKDMDTAGVEPAN